MTAGTHGATAAREGFVTYDALREPELDAALWAPERLPLPTWRGFRVRGIDR